jgi:sugar/nucleoside kinase (ribokinase family)
MIEPLPNERSIWESAASSALLLSKAGGGVFNAARNLSRLGHQVTLVAPRGGDAAAEAVARAARGRSRGLSR